MLYRKPQQQMMPVAISLLLLFFFFLIAFFLLILVLRNWIAAAVRGTLLRVRSLACRTHYGSDEAACDVLVLFRDPMFPDIDLAPFLSVFEDAEIIDMNINYALPMEAMGHAVEAKHNLLSHYQENPSKRYTLLGFGIGGYAAAYCASTLPQETTTYETTCFSKQRARLLMVGTPVGGLRSFFNATIARLFLHPALRKALTIGSLENRTFWENVGVLQHAFFLVADNDTRTSPSRQTPPTFSTKYVETRHCNGRPWFGLCTESNVHEALGYLWNPAHNQ
jgi:hypothetical protein